MYLYSKGGGGRLHVKYVLVGGRLVCLSLGQPSYLVRTYDRLDLP